MKTTGKFLILFFTIAIVAAASPYKSNKSFPELTGTTLNDKQVTLPNDAGGKYTIVGMAYGKDAEADLQTWFEPGYETFVVNFFQYDFDVNLFFVPMLGGANKMFANKVEKDMKEKLDEELKPYVLLFKGNTKDYENALGVTDNSKPYFYVLDPRGKIVYETSGPYSEAKLAKMVGIVRRDR